MGAYSGVKKVLDLEACLDFGEAGANRKVALFQAAKQERIAITSEVLKGVRKFNPDLAKEFEASDIEIIDCDEAVYQTVEHLAMLLTVTAARIDKAASDKLLIIALANCAQNGSLPKCAVVTGDPGTHKSSMQI